MQIDFHKNSLATLPELNEMTVGPELDIAEGK